MPDGVDISPGAGVKVASDDCGIPGHAQIVKLAVSADGSATHIGADATFGLDVDVTRTVLPTSTAFGCGAPVTVTTVATALPTSIEGKIILLQADPDNSVDIFFGDEIFQPFQLLPGTLLFLPITNANKLSVKTISGTAALNWGIIQ